MPGFADDLGAALTGTLQRAKAPPPPPPAGTFADGIAAFFGGGPNLSGAYDAGIEQRGKYTAQSAQTLNALAEAEKRRQEALRESTINDVIAKARANPAAVLPFADALAFGTSANDVSNANLGFQERDLRGGVADLATPQEQRLANMEAITARPVERFYQSGTGMQASQLDPAAAPTVTPVGEAQILDEEASARQHDRSPAAGAAQRAPAGYRYTADGNLEYIPGGPQDPTRAQRVTLPARTRQAAASNAALLANIERAMAIVEMNPTAFGLQNVMGDTVNQRLDPEGVEARAAVADIGSAKMHDRSGAAITAKEFPRLTPFIPSVMDKSEAILVKLARMRDAIQAEQDALTATGVPSGAPVAPGAAPAGGVDPRVQQYADQYLGGDVAKATAILRSRGAIP